MMIVTVKVYPKCDTCDATIEDRNIWRMGTETFCSICAVWGSVPDRSHWNFPESGHGFDGMDDRRVGLDWDMR